MGKIATLLNLTVVLLISLPSHALPLITNLPAQWKYNGCLHELAEGNILPHQILFPDNTPVGCVNHCAKFGYSVAAVKHGNECFCGDISDVTGKNGVFGEESECSTPCAGNPVLSCGADQRLNAYYWPDLVKWEKPSNIGRYEYLVPGVVVPIMAQLGHNNKVTFLELKDGGSNSTGAYELDVSLANDFSHAWREMHVKTDIFCGATITLPDKAGRQISVAGWDGPSAYGVRFYTPDGQAGVNGTNDWEENVDLVKLQRPRWYNTAGILANGSVLVIGGRIGADGPPQPNLEVLPKPDGGDTVVELDYLARTDPYSLYPEIVVLPSQRLFIAYYNEARILDPATFATVKVLPNIPGAVDDPEAGRTWPLSGALVPLPQHFPYSDPLQVLICGGSTVKGFGTALDNCVTMAPEVDSPTWTIERMPSKRVIANMVPLPDGTTIIVNGAQAGKAGFATAEDPNLTALLYDPSQQVGSRISVLNTTTIARLYHSEAILLSDGRVLISGSTPKTNWPNGTVKYPQEYRVEVYYPPYLTQGLKQPTFAISNTDWAYGGKYDLQNINIFQGKLPQIRVSLISSFGATHANAMGARTIFPKVTCKQSTCTVVAPPNAGVCPPGWYQLFVLDGPTPSHSQWVRIGGDPAQLGNWPNYPGFTLPGV